MNEHSLNVELRFVRLPQLSLVAGAGAMIIGISVSESQACFKFVLTENLLGRSN